jgi:hypothetical protein
MKVLSGMLIVLPGKIVKVDQYTYFSWILGKNNLNEFSEKIK